MAAPPFMGPSLPLHVSVQSPLVIPTVQVLTALPNRSTLGGATLLVGLQRFLSLLVVHAPAEEAATRYQWNSSTTVALRPRRSPRRPCSSCTSTRAAGPPRPRPLSATAW